MSDNQTRVISSAKNTLKQSNAEYVGMFFMNTPPTLCLERINGRNRNGEELITADYLENIEKSCGNTAVFIRLFKLKMKLDQVLVAYDTSSAII